MNGFWPIAAEDRGRLLGVGASLENLGGTALIDLVGLIGILTTVREIAHRPPLAPHGASRVRKAMAN